VKTTDTDGEIKGAAEWNGVFYWATDTKLKSTTVAAANFASPTTVSTGLTSSDWHTMSVLEDSLYIANGNDIARVALDGSFNLSAIDITPDCTVKCMENREGYMVIGAVKNDDQNEGYVFLWDAINLADTWDKRFRVQAKGVNALVSGEYLIGQVGDGIYRIDFVNNLPIQRRDDGQVRPDGTATKDGYSLFGFYGNTNPGIYSYGREKLNMPAAFNLEYTLSTDPDVIGAITTVSGVVLASWKDGSTYGVDALSATTRATATYESLEWFAPPTRRVPVKANQVKIITKAMPASTSISMKYKLDKSSSWTTANISSGGTTFNTTGAVECFFNIGEALNIFELQFTLTPNATDTPEILRIETYLDNI